MSVGLTMLGLLSYVAAVQSWVVEADPERGTRHSSPLLACPHTHSLRVCKLYEVSLTSSAWKDHHSVMPLENLPVLCRKLA